MFASNDPRSDPVNIPVNTHADPASAVGGVAHAIDEALDVDPDMLDDDALTEALIDLHRQAARLAAARARLTQTFDARRIASRNRYRSTASWVAHRCRLPINDARAELRLARRLCTMPATAAALAAGAIGLPHAHRLASLNAGRTAAAFADAEETLVGHARHMDWPDFHRATTYWRQVADPDGTEADAASDAAQRRLHLSETIGGTGILDGILTPLAHATVNGALSQIGQELFDADWRDARTRLGDAATTSDLRRTPAQRRHDALVEMAERAMAAPRNGRRPRPLLTIHMGYETFAGRLCELADGTPITPGTALAVLDAAMIERIVFDGPSRVIDVGERRFFTGALRRAIEVRDRRCTGPGCHVPAQDCEIDHIIPHHSGGPTTQVNGQTVCPYHHRQRHRDCSSP